MTETEALEILKRDDDDMRKGYFCINDFTALEVAKKALEKQEVAKEYGKDTNVRSNGWIPVEEGLPNWEIEDDYTEDVHTVLQWWDGDITYGVGWYRKNFGWSEDGVNCKVIAWMPIAPYQKGE